MPQINKPKTWQDCEKLAADPRALRAYLLVRLIELTTVDQSAIRAVEQLLGFDFDTPEDDYHDIPAELLRAAYERADKFIKQNNG